jgi:hypothetical protein
MDSKEQFKKAHEEMKSHPDFKPCVEDVVRATSNRAPGATLYALAEAVQRIARATGETPSGANPANEAMLAWCRYYDQGYTNGEILRVAANLIVTTVVQLLRS